MNTIKDQVMPKNKLLVKNIVEHAVEQANFTIKNLGKRSTVAMLMECENCLTDFMPVVKLIADDYIEYVPIHDQMCAAIDAVQVGKDLVEIEFA
ncbi:hypothetical protein CXF76_11580 [Pseudoalteromonas sp. 78C3]|uniref:hypothetical protein n=1 Tax=Pseudoalteromonas sp. 78C3 TaxID=2058300 RepID=UPI000C32FDDB|nr:hypothetical protein [Pseudoalteromonas sp. 78C3]PKH91405.1 hypothetical protein CXF76_11580 [Pseudoalteromonas sp. 78C3]